MQNHAHKKLCHHSRGMALCLLTALALWSAAQAAAQQAWRFDFQPVDSVVAEGYQGVNRDTAYTPQQGHGWERAPQWDRNREMDDPLTGDLLAGPAPATFRIDLPDGDYTLTLHMGDTGVWAHDMMQVLANGEMLIERVDTAAGEIIPVKAGVTARDGRLELTFRDTGGSDDNWFCAGLEIETGKYTGPAYKLQEPQPEIRTRYISEYGVFSEDGAWCWFADPRAVWHEGLLYMGWITEDGSVQVGNYDPDTGKILIVTIRERFQVDDHDNPSLLFLPDGRLTAFYSGHFGSGMFARDCEDPAALADWSQTRSLDISVPEAVADGVTYPNPYFLAEENNRLYLFWRGYDWKPTWAYSDNAGETWTPMGKLVEREGASDRNRPYAKFASDGQGRIDVIFTDGHPRQEPRNNVYHAYYEDGAWHKTDGTVIATIEQLPFQPQQATQIYDGSTVGRGWVWDIALDSASHPAVVYMTAPEENDHRYRYARWDGTRWHDAEITKAGGWFPQTPEGRNEPEPHYSGGIALDHDDPSIVYLSREIDGVFEIERWQTGDGGETWSHEAVTRNSTANNVRPIVARNHQGREPHLFWMTGQYVHYTNYNTQIRTNIAGRTPQSERIEAAPQPTIESTLANMRSVCDWQLEQIRGGRDAYRPDRGWVRGAFDTGLMAAWRATGDAKYYQAAVEMAESNGWRLGRRIRHADDHVVGQMYAELHEVEPQPERIAHMRETLDYLMANPLPGREDYWWCDALYMAPPAWARLARITGEQKYLDFTDRLFWDSTEFLYDPAQQLYFRDQAYFDRTEGNGESIFWSRGNGWVIAGIARMLQYMPEDYPSRDRYITLFREMAQKLVEIQPADGLWRASLLHPEGHFYGEASGSGFFCYAMAWGINAGILDRATYEPVVRKTWKALNACVHEDGKLGYVQQIGASPAPTSWDSTQEYGVGAFLLAGEEMLKLMGYEMPQPETR